MKKVLSFDNDLTEGYRAIGISSHLRDFRLCWNLNNILKADFKKNKDLEFASKKSPLENFSFFFHYNSDQRCFYYLLSNKKNNSLILEKMSQADYILLINGPYRPDEITQIIIQNLKKTTNILTAFLIDMSKIKAEMNHFLNDLELHYDAVVKDSKLNLLIQH
jgi:hypothetical protein